MSLPRESLLVVGAVRPLGEETVFPKEVQLPPHVTLLPWFEILETQIHRFSLTLTRLAERHHSLRLEAGEEDLFGVKKDIPVQRIIACEAIRQIHIDLVRVASTFGAQIDQRWSGDNYRPHITHTDEDKLQEGEVVVVPALQVFSRSPNGDKILRSEHEFGMSDEQTAA